MPDRMDVVLLLFNAFALGGVTASPVPIHGFWDWFWVSCICIFIGGWLIVMLVTKIRST